MRSTMNAEHQPAESTAAQQPAADDAGEAGGVIRAATSETAGFLYFLIPQAALMLAAVVTALVAELEADLRGMLVAACGVPGAGLIWLIVWAARNPLPAERRSRDRAGRGGPA
jgi:hypothetical protein